MTDRQKLVSIDERFIQWITEVDNHPSSTLQFQGDGHNFVFVRIYASEAVDIQGLHDVESMDGMIKTVGGNLHEGYFLFDVNECKEMEQVTGWAIKYGV